MRVRWTVAVALVALIGCASGEDDSNDKDTDTGTTASDTADTSSEDTGPEYTIWTGDSLVFEKPDFGDPTDPSNQDAISEFVALTRGESGSLFNVITEAEAASTSPEGTEWSEGTTADIGSLEFEPLKTAAGRQMNSVPGTDFVLHLIEEDIYIDVTFLSWTSGNNSGGGFSYERSTPN